ncbi:MAG TPA: membrane protein insertase YidC [Phycisphaerales bacterium]|nr:membrane protein insertase YidC [Phycisphaerales bacterium]
MADGSKSVARIVVPVIMALLVVALGFLLFGKKPPQPPAAAPGAAGTQSAAGAAPALSAEPAGGATGPLHAVMQPVQSWDVIGSLDTGEKVGPLMRVAFQPEGAGILELKLSQHRQSTEPTSENEVLQRTQIHAGRSLVPFALVDVTIDGRQVRLAGTYRDATGAVVGHDWKQVSPGVFAAEIADAAGTPVARVTRSYKLVENLYELTLDQTFENLTDRPMSVRFTQLGPVELPIGIIRYGGDPRRVRMGIITGDEVAGRSPLLTRDDVLAHAALLNGQWVWPDVPVWPTEAALQEQQSLSWIGVTNRFFAVTVHALPDRATPAVQPPNPVPLPDKRLTVWERVDRVVLTREPDSSGKVETEAAMALRGHSPALTVPARGTARADMGVYAGPIDRDALDVADTRDGKIALTDLEIYFWPGPCSFCTFQPIAYGLRFVLSIFADHVVFDWALAIILLVVCVRTALHPITKWSQTSLQRFGKAMQRVAPKQKALQEKFKDDPARLRQEISNLMREENVNYAQALGCIPMLLQTPIWIALSSLMFFLFDLRHTPAFFGVFQSITGGKWQFLADLAEPDHFFSLPFSFTVPLMGMIDSINVLPVLLGVVFFVQQKYLTPPPTAQLSPEMETQQKIMKIVIVFLFPLMMYNAPSGLAIYFITNSALGIVESRHIRKKFEKEEAARDELLKKNPHAFSRKDKKEGFMGRFQARIAEAQARAEQLKQQQAKNKGGKYGPRG